MKELKVTSPAFEHNQAFPKKYSCDEQDINPPINIENIPEGTKSLVLILNDPDAPAGLFDHWLLFNISPHQSRIGENSAPGTEGLNSGGTLGYTGPCPPPGKPHRYIFNVYALDIKLDLEGDASSEDVEEAMEKHVLAQGKLIGLFKRNRL